MWIKTEDEFPEDTKDVLFTLEKNITMGFCINERFYSYEAITNKGIPPSEVKYWMYVPAPPSDVYELD